MLQRAQAELALDVRELDEVRQCGTHAPVLADLLPTARAVVVQVGRRATKMRQHDMHALALFAVEPGRDGRYQVGGAAQDLLFTLLALLQAPALPGGCARDEEVDLVDLAGGRHCPRALQRLVRRHVTKDDGVTRAFASGSARSGECPKHMQDCSRSAVDDFLGLHSVDIVNGIAAEHAQDVELRRLHADGVVVVGKEGGDEVEAKVDTALGVVGVGQFREVLPGGVHQQTAHLPSPLIQGLVHLQHQAVGRQLQLTVPSRVREVLKLRDVTAEVVRQGHARRLEGEARGQRAQQGRDDLSALRQGVMRQELGQELLGVTGEALDDLRLVAAHKPREKALVVQEGGHERARSLQRRG
mmetsp:Transcript_74442/g.215785  ORF Transcript_74442/g.215785 Transcript_74442/m.215785 type:complete len:357 (-) Transcript_74442:356-1426(-)